MLPITENILAKLNRVSIKFRLFRYLPLIALLFLLLVTQQLWKNAKNETEEALRTEFEFHVLNITRQIKQRMLTYDHMLRGVQGLFAASASVDRNEFHAYVNELNLEKNFPGLQGLGFALLVPKQNKDKHISAIRNQGFQAYSIFPEGVRDPYTTVLYFEPYAGRNLHLFGYDNFTDPVRRSAMERARDTGLCAATAKLKLVKETESMTQAGFLMWLPVYKNGVAHQSMKERRDNLTGWVGASFRMDDLMTSIFPEKNNYTDLEIYDGEEISDESLMYDADKIRRDKGSYESRFQNISVINIAGHNWTLLISSLPAFDKRMNNQKPRFIAIGGIIVSILLSLIAAILVYGRHRALQSAMALNLELAERKRAEAGMRLTEKVFETVDAAVLVTDASNRIIKVNPAFTGITGYSASDAIGRTTTLLSSGAHPPEFYKAMWETLSSTGSWQGEIYNRRKNGEFYTEWLSINEVRDNDGTLTNYIALFSDISERKAAEAHMHNLAHYDPLTGLPNRTLLADRLQQAIVSAKREKSHMALMFVDLDKFKPINDMLGHHVGDLMLKEVAKRMHECMRESDTAARIGGDEFVVLLPLIEEVADALSVAEKIRDSLNQSFKLAGQELSISSSIGVAVYPDHGTDEKLLLTNADIAMYNAKEAGRNRVMLYEPNMHR